LPLKKLTVEGTRINKFIANAGICNRRQADKHILAGKIKINGKVVTELGLKVMPNDEVFFESQLISTEQKLTYILINKPQDFTTKKISKNSIWQIAGNINSKNFEAVHHLSSVSCGLCMITNDNVLIDKFKNLPTKKLYYLQLKEELTTKELKNLETQLNKVKLNVQDINFVQNKPQSHIGIKLYDKTDISLFNIFKRLNLKVVKLDRVMFANITKKDLSRGRSRHLTTKEVITLKHF